MSCLLLILGPELLLPVAERLAAWLSDETEVAQPWCHSAPGLRLAVGAGQLGAVSGRLVGPGLFTLGAAPATRLTWSHTADELELWRPALGSRPLYCARTAQLLLVADRPGTLFATGWLRPEPDYLSLLGALIADGIAPPATPYAGVMMLGAGQRWLWRPEGDWWRVVGHREPLVAGERSGAALLCGEATEADWRLPPGTRVHGPLLPQVVRLASCRGWDLTGGGDVGHLVARWARWVDSSGLLPPPSAAVGLVSAAEQAARAGCASLRCAWGHRPGEPRPGPSRDMRRRSPRRNRLSRRDAAQFYTSVPVRWPEVEARLLLRRALLAPELARQLGSWLGVPPPVAPGRGLDGEAEALAAVMVAALAELGAAVELAAPASEHGDVARALAEEAVLSELFADPMPDALAEIFQPAALGRVGWFDPVTVHLWRREVAAGRGRLAGYRARMLLQVAGAMRLALRHGWSAASIRR